jgi:hypothetical protein
MASPDNYVDIDAPRKRRVRITEAEADAVRVALTKGQSLDERQRYVLRCILHEWRSGVSWRVERERRGKRGLGLRPMTTVVLDGGPLHGVRASMEDPDEFLCGRHGLYRLDARSEKQRDATPDDCAAYVRDHRAHPADPSIAYSYAADLYEEARKVCRPRPAQPANGIDEDQSDF